jgi:hypothetical protein
MTGLFRSFIHSHSIWTTKKSDDNKQIAAAAILEEIQLGVGRGGQDASLKKASALYEVVYERKKRQGKEPISFCWEACRKQLAVIKMLAN